MEPCKESPSGLEAMSPHVVYVFDKVFWPPREGCHLPPNMHLHYLAGSGLRFTVVLIVQPHEEDLVSDFCKHYASLEVRPFKVSDLGERFASRYVALKKEHSFHSMLEAYQVAVGHAGLRDELAKADILITNYVYSAPLITYVPGHCVSIVETHDVQSSQHTCLMRSPATTKGNGRTREGEALFRRLFQEETELLDLFDSVIAIAGDEAETLALHVSEDKVTYIPPATIPHVACSGNGSAQYDLLFVGGHHEPNLRSIQAFYRDSFLPYLKPRGIRLALAGKVGQLSGIEDESVVRLGFVKDLGDAYRSARVVICPILYGAGCNIKVLEALAYGKAVVATPQALRGLNVDRSGLFVASDPHAFARHVTALLDDPALLTEHEQHSRKLARRGHSLEQYERLWRSTLSRALRQLEDRVAFPYAQSLPRVSRDS
jgi:glycosyltransferase involved in cell wall biosynthesis